MVLERIVDKVIDTDFLVVGGAIGGSAAAAKAAEHGLKVTLAEKAKTDRSGTSGQGIDHYGGAFPRGMTVKEWKEFLEKMGAGVCYGGGPYMNQTRLYRQYANGFWGIEEMEKLGVTMRWDDGDLRPIKNFFGPAPFTRVHWYDCKPQMAAGVRKRGVNVLERTMVVDLLTNNGAVVGATAIDTRTGEFIVIRAKAVVVATGMFGRLYGQSVKYYFIMHPCPAAVSGDGWAMAYRAGAELANLEQSRVRGGMVHDLTMSHGNIRNEGIAVRMRTWDGDEVPSISRETEALFVDLERKGKAPFYYDFGNLPDDFHKRIEVCYVDERMIGFKVAEDRGFNPRTHWYETMQRKPTVLHAHPGIEADENFQSTVKGLFAIGDCSSGSHDVANAATSGFLVGDSIESFIKETAEPVIDEAQVESQKETALAPLSVKDGTESKELEQAVQNICMYYIASHRSEGMLLEGLRRLGSLKKVFIPQLKAKNPHELMRCLEVRNIMDVAEAHMQVCLERKETHGSHYRLDYPEPDPSQDDLRTYQRLENGQPVLEMRKVKPLEYPDDHKEER